MQSFILNIPFNSIKHDKLIEALDNAVLQKVTSQVCFVPVNSILAARRNPEVFDVYLKSEFVICDGVPVKWASRFLGMPIVERITGLDFMPDYVKHCAEKGFSLFFLGAAPGVAEALLTKYTTLYPHIQIKGTYSPPFEKQFSEEQNDFMKALVNQASPDVLMVSLTAPKQDLWIRQMLPSLQVKVAMGVGAAFDVEVGRYRRAPLWMQRTGLEWFYRFLQEPRRMFRRYFVEAPIFIPLIFLQKMKR